MLFSRNALTSGLQARFFAEKNTALKGGKNTKPSVANHVPNDYAQKKEEAFPEGKLLDFSFLSSGRQGGGHETGSWIHRIGNDGEMDGL